MSLSIPTQDKRMVLNEQRGARATSIVTQQKRNYCKRGVSWMGTHCSKSANYSSVIRPAVVCLSLTSLTGPLPAMLWERKACSFPRPFFYILWALRITES
ncbi:hypothetical protein NPIL_543071 [Nephila pilipes]|uniref:Uncharacterized protein n=1 Tax=Nephila pilipes TaxID=299642 RepID=A0A8X6UER8_NEPPI|nr:hypothetical protein NPIL_543071 [Nephila pilipes]